MQRAERRLPKRPTPAVPVLRNPTRAQTRAAQTLINRAVLEAAGRGGTGRQRLARRDEVERELRNDPRQRKLLEASRHYTKADLDRVAERWARAAGVTGGTRNQRVALGKAILAQRRSKATSGKADTRIGGASSPLNVTAAIRVAESPFTRGQGIAAARFASKDVPKIAGRAAADALNLPKNAAVGLYQMGAAGVEAAQGDTKRAKRLIGGLDEGALGQTLRGNFPKAAKEFSEHPLYSLLEFTGAGQVAGRSAGAAARSGALGKRAKRGASTRRAPLELVAGSNQRQERSYSPNVIVKAMQVAGERSARRQGRNPNVATGDVRSGLSSRGRRLNAAVDEFAAQAEGTRRRGRQEMARDAARIAPVRRGDATGGRRGRAVAAMDRAAARGAESAAVERLARPRVERDIVLAAVEGRLRGPRTFKKDLIRERDRLQTVYRNERTTMTAETRRANREQVKSLDRVLSNPKALANAAEVFRSADAYTKQSDGLTRKLVDENLLDRDQVLAAKVRPYAISVMGAKPGKDGLRDRDGKPLTTAQIVQTMKADPDFGGAGNLKLPGFVSHRRDQSGANAYFVNWFGSRKTADAKKRTGEATRTGGHAAGFRALEENLVRAQGLVDAVQTFDRFSRQFGQKAPDGKHYTWDEAERVKGSVEEATGVPMVAVRVAPARYDEQTLKEILDRQASGNLPSDMERLVVQKMDDALRAPQGKARQARNVVFVPEMQLKRFREHQTKGSGVGAKLGQVATAAFRKAVLPVSTKWMVGNVVEATLRSATHGIGPGDVARGRRVMRELEKLDAEAFKQADTRVRGGLLFGGAENMAVRRASEDFEGSVFFRPAQAVQTVGQIPVMRQVLGSVDAFQRSVFAVNRGIERAFQTGVIGKQARREVQELTGSWAKGIAMQKDVAREVAAGLTGTEKQVQFARRSDEILGKYNRFSPGTRRIIQTFSPFLPWFLNAARFSLHTLPAKHPVKAALLASVEQTFAKEIEEQGEGVPPGSLRSAIVMPDGGRLDIARYMPFGAFTEGTAVLADPLLPQLSSVVNIVRGQSWTGRPLRLESGEEATERQKALMALNAVAESTIPFVGLGRRLQEEGETAWDDSTVFNPKTKPGTSHGSSAANRVFNPLRPTYLKAPRTVTTAAPSKGKRGPATIEDIQRRLADAQERAASKGDTLSRAQEALAGR